jgi:hypothetical protein
VAAEEAAASKPKEKTIFNVKLESFDAGAKPKVIKEVKALVPNLTLIEVGHTFFLPFSLLNTSDLGEKVRRVFTQGTQRGYTQGRRGEDQKSVRGAWRHRHPRLNRLPACLSSISLWE